MRRPALGRKGEALAERYLRSKGYRILARRWSCRVGEIDLIAMDGNEVVFVEVKTRSGSAFGAPEESVTALKRMRLRRAAHAYLAAKARERSEFRIDVIAVRLFSDRATLRHLVSAVGDRD